MRAGVLPLGYTLELPVSFKTKRMGALFLQTWTGVAWSSPQASGDMKQMVPSIHGQVPAPLGAPTSQQCAATLLCSLPSTPLQLLTTHPQATQRPQEVVSLPLLDTGDCHSGDEGDCLSELRSGTVGSVLDGWPQPQTWFPYPTRPHPALSPLLRSHQTSFKS